MSDTPVCDLEAARAKRREIARHNKPGVCFAFERYEYLIDPDGDDGIGFDDTNKETPIVLITNRAELRGIAMSAHDALALGAALVECARAQLFPDVK